MRNHHPQASRLNLSQEPGISGMAWVPTLMLVALACTALLIVNPAEAATTPSATNADATARYHQERAACVNGQSNQDRATCLKEAGAAYAEAKRGGLKVTGDTGDSSDKGARTANATQRCIGLPADESKACMERMQGGGSISGSVASGGILRELVTVEPAASAASATVK